LPSNRDDYRDEALAVVGTGTAIGLAAGVVAFEIAPRESTIFSNASYWFLWSVLALGVLWLGRRVPFTGNRRVRAFLLHAAASLLFAVTHLKVWTLAVLAWTSWRHQQAIPFVSWLTDLSWLVRWQIEWEVTMYWALIGLAHADAYRKESRERALAAARLDAELSQARLHVLQQQMHPHFLFNTLQSISVLMHHSVDDAELMIERLGELLRGSLRANGGTVLVPVSRELEYVAHYLAIEQLNMGKRLRVSQDIGSDALRCRMPELLLQPLVENAVRHGIAPAVNGGTVAITARRVDGRLDLSVVDDGVGMGAAHDGAGIALNNTRRRLDLLFRGDHSFNISEGPAGRGVAVRISLPAVEEQ